MEPATVGVAATPMPWFLSDFDLNLMIFCGRGGDGF